MSHWQKIRERAAEIRRDISRNPYELCNCETIIEEAVERFDLCLSPEHKDSANLRRSLAVLEDDIVFFDNALPAWFKNYCIAHEIGHFVLHQTSVHCDETDIENFETDNDLPTVSSKIIGYGAGERREREANLFALEFILPCEILKKYFNEKNLTATEISKLVGLPKEIVYRQLTRAVLLPEAIGEAEKPHHDLDLDESQKRAAEAENCPLLITAGPGTGKTQTLIKRILFLLEKGISPDKILALTFSNKATEEMRERIAKIRPDESKQVKIMTFHSFGLEILRKYWQEANLNPDSNLLEKIDAVLYLEKNLAALQLEHYQTLHEPTQNLPAILGAISRAKDELFSPEKYRQSGEEMIAESTSEEDKIKAEKVLEVAAVYRFYQDFLEREKFLDFGDLIFRSVCLLRENAAVKEEIRNSFEAILVDEFQDVNRASGVLLREIAGDGKGLWAVGDLRQSIYRWRGASPANLQLFKQDFPSSQTLSLENNYRSTEKIIRLFAEFAKKMKAASDEVFSDWKPHNESLSGQEIFHEIAENAADEAENLAENVFKNLKNGVAFKDQAVICRTHSQLNKFAEKLSEKGIPILYLGEIFERDEIRDLLALLALRNSSSGLSLVRVANFAEYEILLADVKTILEKAGKEDSDFLATLDNERIYENLSVSGKAGIEKLKRHLFSIAPNVSAWQFLCEYLFEKSDFLKSFTSKTDVQTAQKLLAIYQFLNFAKSQESRFATENEAQISAFLRHIRRLARLSEDRNFAQVPAAAENLDAVRLLTVHAAKGLEFDTVYLPHLAKTYFPQKRKGEICPNPKNLTEIETDFHLEEEECLFFVAMSRAKKRLYLSRAQSYGKTKNAASDFLEMLTEVLLLPKTVPSFEAETADRQARNEFYKTAFSAAQIERYQKCPRQFYYRDVLQLKEKDDFSIYRKFHSAVYEAIGELQKTKLENALTDQTAQAKLAEIWSASDLDEHAYAPIYRAEAETMIAEMFRKITESDGEFFQDSMFAELENGIVFVKPNYVEISETEVCLQRFRTRKSPRLKDGKKDEIEDADVLINLAAQKKFEAQNISQEIFYLQDGTARSVEITARTMKNRVEKFNKIIESINRNEFQANPNGDACPSCAYFFICPK